MVIFGGLEIVAAGYLIHKHQQNKKDKQRIDDEAAALEESQYRIYSDGSSSHQHRRRSHSRERRDSRGRHSHERQERRDKYDRPHSADGKYGRDRRGDRDRPPRQQMTAVPAPMRAQTQMPPSAMRPVPSQAQIPVQPQPQEGPSVPPPYHTIPTAQPGTAPPRDVKYGWTDDRPQQDPSDPPTGWPAHWAQSQTPAASAPGSRLPTSQVERREREGESSRSRGRHERRTLEPNTSRVRFAVPESERDASRSPPPSYRA